MLVSPLDRDCESAFQFTAIGEIIPSNRLQHQEAAAETIKKLGLDVPKLVTERGSALEGIIEGLTDYSESDIRDLISYFNSRDEDGYYTPYCSAIVYLLRWSAAAGGEIVTIDESS